jgi:WD40 repeat protein
MNAFQDAFISYGRADSKAFAAKLNDRLVAEGLEVWFDFEDIPLGVDYQKQIDDGIDQADNFLFIISPHAINSPYCGLEIQRALRRQKRIIPLLHVEEISRDIWQARYPTGTDEDWQVYTEAGKHSSFANMDPAIAKINWVYFRDGIDDFEEALQGLLTIFQRQRDYVHRHTVLLSQALDWEQHQKQARYLLIGEERQQAETWLMTPFKDEQPPCRPTDLHCEFITESTKNANNLMSQVFLAHAETDHDFRDQLRRELNRSNITVWSNKTDIQTGADFKQAIQAGIEEADNVVYLLSPDALQSNICQQEVAFAQKLNKRIIPLLVKPIDLAKIPNSQRSLQFINFADNTTVEQHDNDIAKLLRVLRTEADYYNEHKLMLTKALKWERQHRNPSILLRGYNLRRAAAWLKVAQAHPSHGPLSFQTTFIHESLRQPPAQSLDVFISYSRSDSEFARRLNDALQVQGKTTWFDQESIASGADFQKEIYRGIATADNFLFVLSPRAVKSPYCADEVAYAASLNKRFVPLLYQSVNTQDLPPELAAVQWVDFSPQEKGFLTSFSQLVRTLDTDRDHVHSHTKWSQRAIEWHQKDQSADLLLRGSELAIAQAWLEAAATEKKQPAATALQKDFIEASQTALLVEQEAEQQRQAHLLQLQQDRAQEAEARLAEQKKYARRQKLYFGAVSIALIIASGLGVLAFFLFGRAVRSEYAARLNEIEATSQSAEALFVSNHELEALREAIRAGASLVAESNNLQSNEAISVSRALGSVLYGIREFNRFSGHTNAVSSLSFSADGQLLASASWDHTIRLWQADGQLLRTLEGHEAPIHSVVFSPVRGASSEENGTLLASASEDYTIRLWNAADGTLLQTLTGHSQLARAVAFSPDGQTLVSGSDDGSIKFWNLDGSLRGTVTAHDGSPVLALAFSPDGQQLVSGGGDGTVRTWTPDGELLQVLTGHEKAVYSVAFHPDGNLIASGSEDQSVRLWLANGQLVEDLKGHRTVVDAVAFSPDGKRLASASHDRTLKLWELDGRLVATLEGHENEVLALAFSIDGQLLASAGADNTIRLWKLQQDLSRPLSVHRRSVRSVSFSADGTLMASADGDEVRLWQEGGQVRQLKGHTQVIYATAFSPDGSTLVSTSADQTAKIWTTTGQLVHTLTGHESRVNDVAYSPDGITVVTASRDRTLKIWDLGTGQLLQTLTGHTGEIYGISISPDGQWLASTGRDTTVRLWQRQRDGLFASEPDRILQLPEDQRTWNRDVTFSPDGTLLAVAGYDRLIRLWNWRQEQFKTLEGHGAVVYSVNFSEGGKFLASASGDQTVRVWDTQGRLRLTLPGHTDWVLDVAFRPGTNQLASASADRSVILWNGELELQNLLQRACAVGQFYLQYNARVVTSDRALCDGIATTTTAATVPAFTGEDLREQEQTASTPTTREGEFGESDDAAPLPREDRFGEAEEQSPPYPGAAQEDYQEDYEDYEEYEENYLAPPARSPNSDRESDPFSPDPFIEEPPPREGNGDPPPTGGDAGGGREPAPREPVPSGHNQSGPGSGEESDRER